MKKNEKIEALKKKHKKERINQNKKYKNYKKINGVPGNQFINKHESYDYVLDCEKIEISPACKACNLYEQHCEGNNDYCQEYKDFAGIKETDNMKLNRGEWE